MEVEVIKKKDNNSILDGDGPSRKLKVAAYARVSTDMEEQQSSFNSQQKYYLDKITENPNWIFVEVYADEGISGTQAFKRENFMRMINDAQNGKIDLILTKSISRFARNTLDTLKYVRLLKANGVGIVFEEENINTLDMAGELLLTVLSSVAQQESETISSHIRLGFKMKKERGELIGFASCYGYDYDSKTNTMTIREKEAEVIRLIFKTYLKGYGTTSIAKMLEDLKIVSPMGKASWQPCTVNGILRNEKYCGDVIQGKTYTVDSITHKRVPNNGEEDKYYIKDHHEPIISREEWEEAQDILNTRNASILKGRKIGKASVMSGKMRCGFCGKSYTKRINNNISDRIYWSCMTSIKGSKSFCPNSKSLPEFIIKQTFMESYYLLTNNEGLALDQFVENIKESLKDSTPELMKAKYVNLRDQTKSKLNKLVDLYVDGEINRDVYERKQNGLQDKLSDINSKISEIEKISYSENKFEKHIMKLKDELKSRESVNKLEEFDNDVFNTLVDYIIIGGLDETGTPNEYLVRFICKSGFEAKSRKDVSADVIINNGLNNKTDGIYIPVIDFLSTQKFYVFENVNGRRQKKIIDKIRVRVELEK